jgi:NADPH-dependent 2,4-dienoyl-CoA reductase/sulfur reductase-like enzyme
MREYQYLIIGGGIAGGKACQGIREADSESSLALITREDHPPYHKPPLSKDFLKDEAGLDRVYIDPVEAYEDMNVNLLMGREVVGLSPEDHVVHMADGEKIGYEKLLLATGGSAIRLPIWGNDLENVFTLRAIEDSKQIRKMAGANARALVLGGSFIGSEVAASLAQMGTEVVQVFPESRLLEPVVPEELSTYLNDLFETNNIRVLSGTVADGLEGETAVQGASLDNGENLEIDFVVMGVGITLNTGFVKEAGLEVDVDGGVIVDETLQTSHPDIYAAGDITIWPDPHRGRDQHVEHWDVARGQGLVAGRNMAGQEEAYQALPYFFSDLFEVSFEVWGDLSEWQKTVRRGSLEEGSVAYYYFDQNQLVGVMAMGRPDEEREAMQKLPVQQPTHADVAEKLKDESFDLRELVG